MSLNWLRGFRRLGWILIMVSIAPSLWVAHTASTHTVVVLGDIPTSMDARPVLAEFRENERVRTAKEKLVDSKHEWERVFKVGNDYKAVSKMSDTELLEALKREHQVYDLLTLIPFPSEQQRIDPRKFAGIFLLSMLAVTILVQGTIFVAAWVLRGFRHG